MDIELFGQTFRVTSILISKFVVKLKMSIDGENSLDKINLQNSVKWVRFGPSK